MVGDAAAPGRGAEGVGVVDDAHLHLGGDRGRGVVARHALVEARLDVLALAGKAAHPQRGDDALHRDVGGAPACVGAHAEERTLQPRPARQRLVAATLGLDHAIVGGVALVRPLRAEGGDRAVDEVGVDLREVAVAEAQAVHDARDGVLDDHVGAPGEPARRLAALVRLQVEDDALLSPVPHAPGGHGAEGVAAGRLDLDDLGAVVGQDHGRHAGGEPRSEIDDGDAFTYWGHGLLRGPRRPVPHDTRAPL